MDHIHLIDDPIAGLTIVDTGDGLKVCYRAIAKDGVLPSGFGIDLDNLAGLVAWLTEKQTKYGRRNDPSGGGE